MDAINVPTNYFAIFSSSRSIFFFILLFHSLLKFIASLGKRMPHSLAMRVEFQGQMAIISCLIYSLEVEIPLDAVPTDSSTKQIAYPGPFCLCKSMALILGSTHNMDMQRWSFAITRHPHSTNINYIISLTRSAAILINVYLRLQLLSHPE